MADPDRGDVALLALYDRALPQVYGYLMSRCGDRSVAEDLTSETFLAVAKGQQVGPLTVGWLIGIARHKLMDHWRWQARQERLLHAVEGHSVEAEDRPTPPLPPISETATGRSCPRPQRRNTV